MRKTWLLIAALTASGVYGQSPRSPFPWWESPMVSGLDLSDAQMKQIRATVSEYRDRLRGLRAAVNRADSELAAVFNEDPVDQRKASDAIEQLVNARSELTRALSQMDLKLRTVLTPQQWQELQSQQGRGRPVRRRPGQKGPPAITSSTKSGSPQLQSK